VRGPVLAFTVLAIGLIGLLLTAPWSMSDRLADRPAASSEKASSASRAAELEQDTDFAAGVAALQHGDPATAVAALTRFGRRAPHVPEVHVNLGYAYFELGRSDEAESLFRRALQLNPGQANAYYGLGLVYESRGDLDQARDAMRTFIHLSDPSDPHVMKARSALWEWGQASGKKAIEQDSN